MIKTGLLKQAAQGLLISTMMKAVAKAPERLMPGHKPDPLIESKTGLLRIPVSRLDGPEKVSGRAAFAAEFPHEAMTYAALAFSTIAKGRVSALNTASAEASLGVLLVMTHRNAPRMRPMPMALDPAKLDFKVSGGDNLPVMQDDRIHWNGQPIAVVLAQTQEQADHAASLISATYEEETAVTAFDVAKKQGVGAGRMMAMPLKKRVGNADFALANAAFAIDNIYRTPHQNHNAIEPHAATIAWRDDELIVHDASQGVVHTAVSLAFMFGLKERQVHVTSPFVGGGFGGKMLWQHQVLGAAAAKLVGRPVRIALSREGVYRVVGGRPMTEQRVAIGADIDGNFDAIIHTGISTTTRRNALPEAFVHSTPSTYAARSFHLNNQLAYLDTLPNTQMRAPGGAVGTFALESAIDELATKMGVDPIALRLQNEPAVEQAEGKPFSSRHAVEAWRAGAERFEWSRRKVQPGLVRDGDWAVGVGCAAASHPYVRMPGGAARITLTSDGQAKVEIAAHEMGMGTTTVQTQITAARLGLPMGAVSIVYGDSHLPGLVLAGGSQQTASIGAAVMAAHRKLVQGLLRLVGKSSPLFGLKIDDVVSIDSGLADSSNAHRHDTYQAILSRAGLEMIHAEGTAPMPFEMMHWAMHSTGAMFCEVGVNVVTCEIRVRRFLGYFDCGRVLNPKTAASQLRGGIIMGLGLALMEETQIDERYGRVVNPNLSEYHIPVHLDVPAIDVAWTDIADPRAPMGAHGIGELGVTGTAAAVANAIHNATGKRVRDLPITLDKLLR